MKKRRQRIIAIVIIFIAGYLTGSGLAEEISARMTMAMKLTRSLDYYEYHWRGSTDSQLLSMSLYSWQKQGMQRKCLEYVPVSVVEAALTSYTLEDYDSNGNCVYQKEMTSEGTREIYWTYTYDEQERILEKNTWIAQKGEWITEKGADLEGIPNQRQERHYYGNGMSAAVVYDYQGNPPAPELIYMTLYDEDGREVLYKTFGSGAETQEADQTTLLLGAYGREELVCEGDRFIAYRWYNYSNSGNLSYLLEITPTETEPVKYLCTYTVYDYDARNRLKADYKYEPVIGEYRDYYNQYRRGDIDTGIFLDFDGNGWLNGITSVYFMDENLPGEVLYYIFPQKDGTFVLTGEAWQGS